MFGLMIAFLVEGSVPLFWYWNVTVSLRQTSRNSKNIWIELQSSFHLSHLVNDFYLSCIMIAASVIFELVIFLLLNVMRMRVKSPDTLKIRK